MITKIIGEQPFQVLTSSFSISPSTTGYDLEISADGTNFSKLFTVSANTTKLVTNVASGSYYRLKGNVGEVKINWRTSCNSGGGGGDLTNYYTKDETDAAIDAAISGITIDLSDYYTSAQTENAILSAKTAIETELSEAEQVTAGAFNYVFDELNSYNDRFDEKQDLLVSGMNIKTIDGESILGEGNLTITPDLTGYYTSAQTETAIDNAFVDAGIIVNDPYSGQTTINVSNLKNKVDTNERVVSAALNEVHQDVLELSGATSTMVTSDYESGHTISSIWSGSQEDYDILTESGATANPTTFYIIRPN